MAQKVPATLGRFIREQREIAQLSLREMARLSKVSNAYLSQVERGLHEPSIRVLTALADALEVPMEDLLGRDGSRSTDQVTVVASVERSISKDPQLSAVQKSALLGVYRSYVAEP